MNWLHLGTACSSCFVWSIGRLHGTCHEPMLLKNCHMQNAWPTHWGRWAPLMTSRLIARNKMRVLGMACTVCQHSLQL